MKSLVAILLVTAMLVVIPVGKAHKVGDLVSQVLHSNHNPNTLPSVYLKFQAIFQCYLKYRSIESNCASDKANAIEQALTLVEKLQLLTDKETNFLFGLIDINTFVDKKELKSQLQTILKVGDDPGNLKYPMPSRLFKNIPDVVFSPEHREELARAEAFLKKSYADETRKSEEDVALVYKLVEAADLNQQEDTSPKKHYMLCLFAVGTKA